MILNIGNLVTRKTFTYVVENNFEKNHKDKLNRGRNSQNSTERNKNSTSGKLSLNHTKILN